MYCNGCFFTKNSSQALSGFINQSVVTWFLKTAHSVLAKKIINQTVDFVGGLVLGSNQFIVTLCSQSAKC